MSILALAFQLTAIAGSITRVPVMRTCSQMSAPRGIVMTARQEEAAIILQAMIKAKSPRSGRAELIELKRAVEAASGVRVDAALIREAKSLLDGVKDGGPLGGSAAARETASRQLVSSLARAKSARAGSAELEDLSRALDVATASRVDGDTIRQARELVTARQKTAEKAKILTVMLLVLRSLHIAKKI